MKDGSVRPCNDLSYGWTPPLVQDLSSRPTEGFSLYHVVHTAWSAHNNVLTQLQFGDVCTNVGASDAGMALSIHVVPQGYHHLVAGRGKEGKEEVLRVGHERTPFGSAVPALSWGP